MNFSLDKVFLGAAAALVAIDAYFVLAHKGIPNIRTAPAIRQAIIGLMKNDTQKRGNQSYVVVDVGSGNGLFTREIAQAMPEATVIGVEITPQSVWWARWLGKRAKLGNLDYRKTDFMAFDFAQADAIVMYLVPEAMPKLQAKLARETRTGTLIISNKFPLGGAWQPVETLEVKTGYPHQRDVHVYRQI